jgi:acylphosphatase
MSEPDLTRLHAIIDGRVQGVGFRYFVQREAETAGVTGWVRNLFDGQVEVLAEGAHQVLEDLVEMLRRGPRGAYVTQVDITWEPASGEFQDYEIRRTF